MGGVITLFKRSFQSFGSDKCATLAASIAYYTVFALFPMAFVGVALLGYIVGDAPARASVVNAITKIIPLDDTGAQGLNKTLAGAAAAKGFLGLIGIASAAWSASGLFGAIRSALDSVWDVNRPLPMLRAKARDLLLFFSFGGLLALSTAGTGFLQGARTAGHSSFLGPVIDLSGPLFWLLTLLLPLVTTFAAFMVLYKVAPHARLTWRNVLPAAVIAAIFFEFGKNLLTYYIAHLGNFNALAGSLGAAILFLVFVYYSSQVILLAAEFAKHRMLVLCGAVPATDPKVAAPKLSFTERIKGMARRTWVIEERHHERDLPYAPGRMDPETEAPANTKEEVLLIEQQAREPADRDAGIAPDKDRVGKSGAGKAGADDRRLPAGAVPFGSWGSMQPPEAQPAPLQHEQRGAAFLWQGLGYVAALVLSVLVRRREGKAKKAQKAKNNATKLAQQCTQRRLLHR